MLKFKIVFCLFSQKNIQQFSLLKKSKRFHLDIVYLVLSSLFYIFILIKIIEWMRLENNCKIIILKIAKSTGSIFNTD